MMKKSSIRTILGGVDVDDLMRGCDILEFDYELNREIDNIVRKTHILVYKDGL